MSRDYCALISVQWSYKLASNVMIMSPIKKEYIYHNYPLEHIEKAIG